MFYFVLILSKTIACIYQAHRHVWSGNKYPGPSQVVKGLLLIYQNVSDSLLMFFQAMKFQSGCRFTVGIDLIVHEM